MVCANKRIPYLYAHYSCIHLRDNWFNKFFIVTDYLLKFQTFVLETANRVVRLHWQVPRCLVCKLNLEGFSSKENEAPYYEAMTNKSGVCRQLAILHRFTIDTYYTHYHKQLTELRTTAGIPVWYFPVHFSHVVILAAFVFFNWQRLSDNRLSFIIIFSFRIRMYVVETWAKHCY